MIHKAWCNVEEAQYNFWTSSIKFQGHTGWIIDNFNPIWVRLLDRSQLSNRSDLPCCIYYVIWYIFVACDNYVSIHYSSYCQCMRKISYNYDHLTYMTAAARRSFGWVHSIFKSLHGNHRIWKLIWIFYWPYYELCFWCMRLWKFWIPSCVAKSHNVRSFRWYRYASVAATKMKIDSIECWEKRWLNMLRLFFYKVKGFTFEVRVTVSNFIPHFIGHVITYPCWD